MKPNKYLKAVSYNFAYFLVSSLAYLVLTPIAIRVMGGEFYGLWMILFAVGQLSVIGTQVKQLFKRQVTQLEW